MAQSYGGRHIAYGNSRKLDRSHHFSIGASYPRSDEPIVPNILRDALEAPVQLAGYPEELMFSDLDESAWERFTPSECRQLAVAAVSHFRRQLAKKAIPHNVLETVVPPLPRHLTLEDLPIDTRTRVALVRSRWYDGKGRLRQLEVWQLLLVRNFGPKATMDYLAAVEAAPRILAPTAGLARGLTHSSDSTVPPDQNHNTAICHGDSATPTIVAGVGALFRDFDIQRLSLVDPRLGAMASALVTAVRGRDANFRLLADALVDIAPDNDLFDSATAVEHELYELRIALERCDRLTIRDELRSLVQALGASDRHVAVVVHRLGWDGRGGGTLQEVADENGLSRERVRQIVKTATDRMAKWSRPYTPRLTAAAEYIQARLPDVAETVESDLSRHLNEPSFRIEGLADAIERLHGSVDFICQDLEAGRWVSAAMLRSDSSGSGVPSVDIKSSVPRTARKLAHRIGAATVSEVVAEIEHSNGVALDESIVRRVLESSDGVRWLDTNHDWFWSDRPRSRKRNRLLNQIRKIMAVATQIRIEELRAGVSRHHRSRGMSLPRQVLLELCRQLPEYRVEGELVIADPPLDWGHVLADTEALMVLVLLENGGAMQRLRFQEECLAAGIGRNTFSVYSSYSPVIRRLATGVYGLLGHGVDPGTVEALAGSIERGRLVIDHGWTASGDLWILYELTESAISSGVLSVPAGIQQMTSGPYELYVDDQTRIGTLVFGGSTVWGFGPLFRRRGGDAGDFLLLELNLSARSAQATLGEKDMVLDELDRLTGELI